MVLIRKSETKVGGRGIWWEWTIFFCIKK
jgi:hypothetical protein